MTTQITCRIELLGGIRVRTQDREISRFRTHKTAALLAYLALHLHVTHAREQLIERFWPDLDSEAGRNNLSTALSSLRAQLEPPGTKGYVLLADRQHVSLNADVIFTDVGEFLALLESARDAKQVSARANLLERALALYRDDLMPGSYDDWVLTEQTRLRDCRADALRQLAVLYANNDRHEAALDLANRLIAVDPFGEAGYQIKMRLLAAQGRSAAALETFATLETLLQRELEITPGRDTLRLAETLRQNSDSEQADADISPVPDATSLRGLTASASEPPPVAPLPVETRLLEALPSEFVPPAPSLVSAPSLPVQPLESRIPTFLPLQLTRFFGRQEELDRLQAWLQPENMRLVTLTGPGGAGKTRIALEVAARLTAAYQGRVRFVSLADVPDARLLSFALAHALRVPASQADPLTQSLEWLETVPTLLILDNFEHLIGEEGPHGKSGRPLGSTAVAWLRVLLERAPGVTCLITSRRLPGLQGEQELALSSLTLPREDTGLNAMQTVASVALYVDRAQRAKPDFALTTANAETIGDLCRRLEGMPLAIEMAAAWAKTITPHKMLERMAQQLDMLVSRQRDLPARHRSLRATCEWSYALLSEDLQRFFARLAVFPGGCTLEAAEAVCGSDALEHLARLQEHSLLVVETPRQPEEEERYRLLEPLRAFAAEKLQQGEEARETQARFVDYFLDFIMVLAPRLEEADSGAWAERLDAEHRNIMAALRGSLTAEGSVQNPVEGEDIQAKSLVARTIRTALELRQFFTRRGYHAEALNFFQTALALPELQQNQEAYSDLLSAVGNCCKDMARWEEAYSLHTRCLVIRQALGDPRRTAATLHNLGNALDGIGKETGDSKVCLDSMSYLFDALQINRQMGNTAWEAYNLNSLGTAAKNGGDLDRAQRYYEQSLQLRRAHKNIPGISHVLFNLGNLARIQEDFDDALTYYRDTLTTSRETGDRTTLLRTLDCMALIACSQQQWPRAAMLIGASSAAWNRFAMQRIPEEQCGIEAAVQTLHRQMEADAYSQAQQQGSAMSLDAAVNYAISDGNV